jgi:alpha-beta hydrolase superfamily lysophospholipase
MISIIALLSWACGGYSVGAQGWQHKLPDGGSAWVYTLQAEQPPEKAKAAVLYVGGSNGSVLSAMGAMASFVMMDLQVFLLERRGLGPEGKTDEEALWISADREQRIADALSQAEVILQGLPAELPVLLVGASEGADIAAELAARSNGSSPGGARIGYLLLLGGGGGMSQADELRILVRREPNALGIGGMTELDAAFQNIEQYASAVRAADSSAELAAVDALGRELWLGHPYRRWASYLWSPPTRALTSLDLPIALVHGAEDQSVPIESARALVEQFRRLGKENLTFIELGGADHSFRDSTGRSLMPVVEVELLAWLRAQGLLDETEHARHLDAVHRAHPELFETSERGL